MCKTAPERTVERAIESNSLSLYFIPGKYKTKEKCKRFVLDEPETLQCLPYSTNPKTCGVEDNRDMLDCVTNQYMVQ